MGKNVKKRAVTDRSQAVKRLAKEVRSIHGPRDAIRLLGWSKRVAGIEIGERCASRHYKPYAKSTVIRWCHRRNSRWYLPLNAEQLEAWARALDNYVRSQSVDARFSMSVNSPWRCIIQTQDGRGKWRKVDLRRSEWR